MEHQAGLDRLFGELLGLLEHAGCLSLERVMHDGTKIRAQAGADTFRRERTVQEHLEPARAVVEERIRFVRGSINDVDLVNQLFQEDGYDYVFHLAACAAEGLSHFIKRFNYENNLIGSVNLINAAVNTGVK